MSGRVKTLGVWRMGETCRDFDAKTQKNIFDVSHVGIPTSRKMKAALAFLRVWVAKQWLPQRLGWLVSAVQRIPCISLTPIVPLYWVAIA
jgi:hypothetical protein